MTLIFTFLCKEPYLIVPNRRDIFSLYSLSIKRYLFYKAQLMGHVFILRHHSYLSHNYRNCNGSRNIMKSKLRTTLNHEFFMCLLECLTIFSSINTDSKSKWLKSCMSSSSVFNYYIIIHKCGFCKLEPTYVSPFRPNKHIVLDNNIRGSLMFLCFNINLFLTLTMHYLEK